MSRDKGIGTNQATVQLPDGRIGAEEFAPDRNHEHQHELAGAAPGQLGEVDRKAQGLQFLHENVEALWNARPADLFALDDGLIGLRAADNVVGLDGEDFLQGVSGAVGFESPDFHLSEPLAAKLRLASKRLLRYE